MYSTASAVVLDYDIETGMTVNQVKDEIRIKLYKNQHNLEMYRKISSAGPFKFYSNVFYAFNKNTNELMYRIKFVDEEEGAELFTLLKNSYGKPAVKINRRGNKIYFFSNNDAGFKLSKSNLVDEGGWQVWFGSISKWNAFAEKQDLAMFRQ